MIHNYDIMSLKSLRRLCGHLFAEPKPLNALPFASYIILLPLHQSTNTICHKLPLSVTCHACINMSIIYFLKIVADCLSQFMMCV